MKRLLLLALVLPLLGVNSTIASVIVTLDSVTQEGNTGIFDWIYRASLQPDQTLRTNDFFTVYDIGNFTGADFGANNPTLQGSCNVTQQAAGINPTGGGTSESGLPNFTVHYTGANLVPDATAGEVTLGNLVVRSTTNQRVDSFFAAQSANSLTNVEISNGGTLSVPVPEPGSITMLIAGLAAAGGLAVRRRKLD
jgi:hypothetical protein